MMIKNILITMLCSMVLFGANAQVNGVVFGEENDNKKEPIYGAKVKLLSNNTGAITEDDGTFRLILSGTFPDTLVITAMGFLSDTIVVTRRDRFAAFEITLYSDQLLPEVVIRAKLKGHSILRMKTLLVENISSAELRKAACCNLSESFETNASVDVNITDAVSGAKKIQMMGLDGVYTQIQLENIPYLRGLESSFGLNSMPGTWIESMQITKGTGNVVNGYESMAGLVNIELKKPQSMEKVYLNAYTNRFGRAEVNFNTGFSMGEKWSSGWFVHAALIPIAFDENNDGFRDFTNGTNFAVFNRYNYEGKNMEAQFGWNAYWDNKIGGQMDFDGDNTNFYGVTLDSRHIDAFGKTGFFMKKRFHSLGIVYNAKYQTLDADFGTRKFEGTEKRGYVNAIYDGIIGNTTHKFKLGSSFVYSDITQKMDSLASDRLELVPGIFGEYSYSGSRLAAVTGVRTDFHNLYGVQVAPRIHLKFALTEYTDLRATGGKGWRVPNYMIDNVSLLASSRGWVAPDTIAPEISWNVGGSYIQRFKLFKKAHSLTVDFYHTEFENQLLVDRDADINSVVFSSLNGKSYSNSLQAELAISAGKQLNFRFAYKWLDVKATYGGELQQAVMVPTHRGFFNASYTSKSKRWLYDFTCSVFGEARLPVAQLPGGLTTSDTKSEVYPIFNAQITHVFHAWEFYLGGENLGNYKQRNAIIDAENPFGTTFDATRIWAPVVGVNVYAGIRYSLKQSEKKEEDAGRTGL
ncbi:MAG: outer membrane receptor for ferrienterochelin and colicins [Crocinitomicaceae bacterium]|jgi:outer membrane receptor for ferrienterochelin and colicins